MPQNLPYVAVVGTLEKMLEKIAAASVPERFTQDFVNTKLAMKGGTPRSMIPFIKKLGLVAGDGTPTPLYLEFRNPAKSEIAMAKCMRNAYAPLFEMNEFAHELGDADLRGLIVEATGSAHDSAVMKKTVSTFLTLKKLADFDSTVEAAASEAVAVEEAGSPESKPFQLDVATPQAPNSSAEGMHLSYTINLHLPSTTDHEVFNAIFKSLKEHLLQR